MGYIDYKKVIILCGCFVLTSIFIYWQPTSKAAKKQLSLRQALTYLKGWEMGSFTQLDPKIVEALKLDDYTNQNYINGSDRVFLYIGYYLTSKKVGAAHDPLVCFPGQGWVISNKTKGKFILNSKTGESISYSSMTVQQDQQKSLIVYWFQSYDQTNSDTLSQKITLLREKLLNQDEINS